MRQKYRHMMEQIKLTEDEKKHILKKLQVINCTDNEDVLNTEQATGLAETRPVSAPRRKRKKTIRTALIVTILACLLTATALAAVYFGMKYRFTREGEQQRYTPGIFSMNTDVYEATMVVRFSTEPESYIYAFRAGWLPSEPTNALSLHTVVEDMARTRLGMKALPETAEEKAQVEAKMADIFVEYGITAEEAENWYTRYDADTQIKRDENGTIAYDLGNDGDIPYQIELRSDLYRYEYLVGYDGSEVELVREKTSGDWQILWLHMDQNGAPELWNCSIVLRFNQAEGYLIKVVGTLDCETLDKIAENVVVLRTDMKTGSSGEQGYGVLTLGRG